MNFNIFKKKKRKKVNDCIEDYNPNVRKLSRTGGGTSNGITLPINILREFKWNVGDKIKLDVDRENKKITIKKI